MTSKTQHFLLAQRLIEQGRALLQSCQYRKGNHCLGWAWVEPGCARGSQRCDRWVAAGRPSSRNVSNR